MLIKGCDLLGKPIIHADAPVHEKAPNAHDILIDEHTLNVSSLVFIEKTPMNKKEISVVGTEMTDILASSVSSFGFAALSNTPILDTEIHQDFFEQTYFIDINKVTEVRDDQILMQDNEREGHDPNGMISLSRLSEVEVNTVSGKSLGKITDVIIDWKTRKMVGLELNEGFWASLFSDGVKYLALNIPITIQNNKLLVSDDKEEKLVDDLTAL